jgi:hypothetical protein
VGEAPQAEHLLMLKLESYAVALQKKETEAFLAIFGTASVGANVTFAMGFKRSAGEGGEGWDASNSGSASGSTSTSTYGAGADAAAGAGTYTSTNTNTSTNISAAPCANIESRTLDAAILLLGSLFASQVRISEN